MVQFAVRIIHATRMRKEGSKAGSKAGRKVDRKADRKKRSEEGRKKINQVSY